MSENEQESKELKLLKEVKKIAESTHDVSLGFDRLSDLCEQSLGRKRIKPLMDFFDSLSQEEVEKMNILAKKLNRENEVEKLTSTISISLDAKDTNHAVAVFNTQFIKFANESEKEELAKRFEGFELFNGYLLSNKKAWELKKQQKNIEKAKKNKK